MGHWYLNLVVEVPIRSTEHPVEVISIDLGLKDSAVLSDGTRIENSKVFSQHEGGTGSLPKTRKKEAGETACRKDQEDPQGLHS